MQFMKGLVAILGKWTSAIGLLLMLLIVGSSLQIFAHGGEDHGDDKPKTQTTDKGTVSHSSRLGDLEVMLKHPAFVPDTATTARLFVTNFGTNQGFAEVNPAIEIESANNSVTEAKVEKTDTAGIFKVDFPALPLGTYTIRTKLTHNGETDTATFSGVEVKPTPIILAETGQMSWLQTLLIAFIFVIVLGLFGGLTYFVLHFSNGSSVTEDTVSA